MQAIKFNTGYYLTGEMWRIEIKDVKLTTMWVRGAVTLYRTNELYFVEVTELRDGQRRIDVTGHRTQYTSLDVNQFLRKFHSLNVI
jgi:hypothetical protein